MPYRRLAKCRRLEHFADAASDMLARDRIQTDAEIFANYIEAGFMCMK